MHVVLKFPISTEVRQSFFTDPLRTTLNSPPRMPNIGGSFCFRPCIHFVHCDCDNIVSHPGSLQSLPLSEFHHPTTHVAKLADDLSHSEVQSSGTVMCRDSWIWYRG